jgi:F0F1-type ATP synthase membrane subunit b/b'
MFPLAVEQVNWIGQLLDFRTNFINWILLVGLLWWAGQKLLPPVFEGRKRLIDSQFSDAAEAKALAAQLLVDHQRKTAQADKAVEEIVVEARQTAEQLRIKLEEQTKQDLEDLKKNFEAACANERQLAISQMREIAVKTALELVRVNLSKSLSEGSKTQLLNQFIEQLDQIGHNEDFAPRQQFEKIH